MLQHNSVKVPISICYQILIKQKHTKKNWARNTKHINICQVRKQNCRINSSSSWRWVLGGEKLFAANIFLLTSRSSSALPMTVTKIDHGWRSSCDWAMSKAVRDMNYRRSAEKWKCDRSSSHISLHHNFARGQLQDMYARTHLLFVLWWGASLTVLPRGTMR
jgi:hypothetical protein